MIFIWSAQTLHATGIRKSRVFEIEAAFLVQFSKYITWPKTSFKDKNSPIIIGIIGRDPFGTKIDRIARTFRTKNRQIEVLRINSDLENADKCHILYISSESIDNMAKIKKAIAEKPILLVSNDTKDFLKQGGIINFIILGTKIRFNISLTNARRVGLKISSQLLRVAKKVQ